MQKNIRTLNFNIRFTPMQREGTKLLSLYRRIPVGRRLRLFQHTKLYVGTWNIRLLVEESGDCQVCLARGAYICGTTLERKVDLLVA